MNISSNLTVAIILGVAFLIGSTGLPFSKSGTFILVSLALMLYFFNLIIRKEKIKSNKLLVFLSVFLVFSLISLIQSIDINNSLITFGWLALLFGVTFYSLNNSDYLIKMIPGFLVVSGVLLSLYSLMINLLNISYLIPKDGYQLVFSRFGSHNHLGDFLVLPMLVCLYSVVKDNKWRYIGLFIFFFPFFIFSYSRSAYLSFFLVGSIFLANAFWKSKHKKNLILPGISFLAAISLVMLFFIATVFESKYSPVLNQVHQTLVENFGLKFKHFGANRPEYWHSAIESIKEKPFFGVGPGNFVYASEKYSRIPGYRTHSSHNIFLDVFSEYGILALLCFMAIIVLVAKSALKNPSLYSLLFFALLVNFQTDYIFRIFSFALLFFLLMGIIYGQNEKRRGGLP